MYPRETKQESDEEHDCSVYLVYSFVVLSFHCWCIHHLRSIQYVLGWWPPSRVHPIKYWLLLQWVTGVVRQLNSWSAHPPWPQDGAIQSFTSRSRVQSEFLGASCCCSSIAMPVEETTTRQIHSHNLRTSPEHSTTSSAILYGLLMFISYYLNNFYNSSLFNVLTNLLHRESRLWYLEDEDGRRAARSIDEQL